MSTHTPGPWFVAPRGEIAAHHPIEGGVQGTADTQYYGGGHLVAETVAAVNRPLIAAAPDLLDALSLLIKSAEDMQGTLRQMDRSRDELDKMGDECAKDAQYAIDCAKQAIEAAGGGE